MKTVIVCDAIHNIGFELLSKESDIHVIDATDVPKDELYGMLGDADVAITRSSTAVDEKFLNSGTNLKAIVRAGVGVDNCDIDGCSKRGIILMNVPTANTIAAVEMTMCHLLNAARKYVNSCNDLKINRIWKREKWYGTELYKKSLGIIGFGNIGSRVGVRALGFGMSVIAYDPYIDPEKATKLGVKYTTNFDDILACDFITIHTPKNRETINMIDEPQIAKMKDGVRLINCARGGLYNEAALVKNLKSGKIAYLGIDVFDKEPATSHEFLDIENLTATPHLGANTLESQRNIAVEAAEQAISAARGISYPNALNLPIKSEDLPASIEAYVDLISKMAYLAAQINKGPIKSIKIEGSGEISQYLNSMLVFAIVGALHDSLGDSLNYVNAKFLADEKGIETEYKECVGSIYKNEIGVTIITDKDTSSVVGTVFDGKEGRIVNVNGFKTDFKPKGKMIIFKNTDVPGVIKNISTILADENINIADFRLGRGEDGNALAVILVDSQVQKSVLEKLAKLDTCLMVRYASL
ncbi:phosphoglycerate dehydrogenase [Campylobacter sp. JMF_04 NA10]|uniref:phosphoglycerate dehydrogenase n=1 Tax=unclassified Campylobacter TaxID=2593542 RepID=UPI0022E9F5AD|nr:MULTISPECIES: phosphoglycerate dehydrogenase [unclassified Campylobacter]MDA3076737.1 phosphoglycerate dehydrogenase [Campylobacter sp. JMF_04 NA10]MDA3077941.1 phosphoglycerate dehydrogenase [Campylobacter sp. JMF_06 NA1]